MIHIQQGFLLVFSVRLEYVTNSREPAKKRHFEPISLHDILLLIYNAIKKCYIVHHIYMSHCANYTPT